MELGDRSVRPGRLEHSAELNCPCCRGLRLHQRRPQRRPQRQLLHRQSQRQHSQRCRLCQYLRSQRCRMCRQWDPNQSGSPNRLCVVAVLALPCGNRLP